MSGEFSNAGALKALKGVVGKTTLTAVTTCLALLTAATGDTATVAFERTPRPQLRVWVYQSLLERQGHDDRASPGLLPVRVVGRFRLSGSASLERRLAGTG